MKNWSMLFLTRGLLIVLVLCMAKSLAADPAKTTIPTEVPETNPLFARQQWIQMDKDLKSGMGKIIRRAMPLLMKEIYKKEVSAPCLGSLLGFTKALRESKLWAYKMIDSCGKFPDGFLHGSLTALGNYEECMEINVNETKVKLQGQYCTLNLLPPLPAWKPFTTAHLTVPEMMNISAPDSVITYLMSFIHNLHVTTVKIGICTPSKCTMEDIDKLVDIIPEQLSVPWKFHISHCEVRSAVEFTNAQIAVLYVIGVIVFLVIMGTVVDIIWSSEEMEKTTIKSTIFHVLKSFSFPSNAKKLSAFTGQESETNFMYGLIVSVFCWNVMSNTLMYVNYDTASNFTEAMRILQLVFYEIAVNRVLPLQLFFYLSGFASTYKLIKSPDKGMNVLKFLLKRYWRYTPTYALIMALILTTPTWGSGPTWYSHMNPMYQMCHDNWWYNLLYINNFMDTTTVCLSHTWLFAVLAQLHIIAVVILIPLKIHPKIGLMLNFVLAVASLASVALTNVYYDLPPNEMSGILHQKDIYFYAEHSYYRVYTHVAIFCTGVFVGYLMAKHPNIKISTKMSCFLWLLTFGGVLTALCIVHEWRVGIAPSPLLSAVYTTFSKVATGAFLAWVTVACMTGHSGGLKDILGWRPFAFFARLTFIAYLMHVPIMNMVMNFKKAPVFVCELEIFYIVLSHAVGSYIVSYVLYLFFEAPWLSLTDVIRKRCKGKTFNSDIKTIEIATEKPFKYTDGKNIFNTMEKGNI